MLAETPPPNRMGIAPRGPSCSASVLLLCLVTGLLMTGGLACVPRSQAVAHFRRAELQLLQESSIAVPFPGVVVAGALGCDGAVVVATVAPSQIVMLDETGTVRWRVSDVGTPVGLWYHGLSGTVEVFERERRVVRISRDGGLEVESIRPPLPEDVLSAVRTALGWWVAGIDRAGALTVSLVHSTDPERHSHVYRTINSVNPPTRGSLTALGDSVYLGLTAPPHSITRLLPDGERGQQPGGLGPAYDESVNDGLVALGLVPLDRGFMQIMADPSREERELVRYDPTGSEVSRTRLSAPIGLLQSARSCKRVLAVVQGRRAELLLYRWTWTDEQS